MIEEIESKHYKFSVSEDEITYEENDDGQFVTVRGLIIRIEKFDACECDRTHYKAYPVNFSGYVGYSAQSGLLKEVHMGTPSTEAVAKELLEVFRFPEEQKE